MYLKKIWNCFRGTIWETYDRQGGLPNIGFFKQSSDPLALEQQAKVAAPSPPTPHPLNNQLKWLEQPAKVAAPSPPTSHPDDSTDLPERVLKAEVRCISGTHLDAGRSCRVQS